MKIWIDLTNSPHVNFFKYMITELQQNHEVLLTCRPLANTIELLQLYEFPHYVVGKHYGQNKVKKMFGFMIRVWQLYLFLRNKSIDVAISHSSFYSPMVAKLLNIRCLYLNDNEYAEGNRISFFFADRILIPEFLDVEKVRKQWAKEKKIIQYPGVKEGIYLWHYQSNSYTNVKREDTENKKVVFIRPEPWTAQYYKGEHNFIDNLLIGLKNTFEVVLLPRDKAQKTYYSQKKFTGIIIPERSINLSDIIKQCNLFIGAGGTMTREAAILGIPTISIYQDKLLDVDKFLIRRGCMAHKRDLNSTYVHKYLEKMGKRHPDKQLLHKGKEAYELIKKMLLNKTS